MGNSDKLTVDRQSPNKRPECLGGWSDTGLFPTLGGCRAMICEPAANPNKGQGPAPSLGKYSRVWCPSASAGRRRAAACAGWALYSGAFTYLSYATVFINFSSSVSIIIILLPGSVDRNKQQITYISQMFIFIFGSVLMVYYTFSLKCKCTRNVNINANSTHLRFLCIAGEEFLNRITLSIAQFLQNFFGFFTQVLNFIFFRSKSSGA